MSLAITELELTDINTILIPTDAILMLSLLIIFALLGYFFHNILNTQTNKFIKHVDDNSNLELVKEKLEDQLILESTSTNQGIAEKPSTKKLKVVSPSKLLGIGSMAVVTIGGASLLGIQPIQNLYKGVNTNQLNIKTTNQSAKTFTSIVKLKSSDKAQTKTKKTSYTDSVLSALNSSENNNFYKFKASEAEDFFSF